jgi:hypothetical protein
MRLLLAPPELVTAFPNTFSARQRLALTHLRRVGRRGATAAELARAILATEQGAARIATTLVCAGLARRQSALGRTIYVADQPDEPA